jgi:hypothetical protein
MPPIASTTFGADSRSSAPVAASTARAADSAVAVFQAGYAVPVQQAELPQSPCSQAVDLMQIKYARADAR